MIDSKFEKTAGCWYYRDSSSRVRASRFYRTTRTLPADYSDESKDFSSLYGVGRGGFPRGGGHGHCYGGGRGRKSRNRW